MWSKEHQQAPSCPVRARFPARNGSELRLNCQISIAVSLAVFQGAGSFKGIPGEEITGGTIIISITAIIRNNQL